MKRLCLISAVAFMLIFCLMLMACDVVMQAPGTIMGNVPNGPTDDEPSGPVDDTPGGPVGDEPGGPADDESDGTQQGPHKHTFDTVWPMIEATCETEGLATAVCNCGFQESRVLPALGHKYDEYSYTYSAHSMTCTRCGIDARASHEFSEGTYSCEVCSFSVEVPSLGYKEAPPEFTKGFVTTEVVFIETEYAIYEIGPGVYVVNDLAEKTDALCRALENVTGLKFENASYDGKKILIGVYDGNNDLIVDGFPVNGTAAYGHCVSGRGDECMHLIKMNPESLFLGQSVTIAHELAHVLRYYQSNYHFNSLIEEGFAQIACERVIKYLEEYDISLAQSLWYWMEGATIVSADAIEFELYTQDIQYWFEAMRNMGHSHQPYVFGDRLMRYLMDECGDYTSWISHIPHSDGDLIQPSAEEEVAIFKAAYGDRVFEDFYAWGEEYRGTLSYFRGVYSPYSTETYDLSKLDRVTIYPVYANMKNAVPGENTTSLNVRYSFTYRDLYIDIDETVRYLRDFKGENLDDLMLSLSDAALVYVFDTEGNFLRAVYSQQIPLKDVGYIKLVGNGYMGCLDIVGYYPESEKITEEGTLFSGSCDQQTSMDFVAWHYQLLFRDDVTIILKLSVPCSLTLVDLDWNVTELENVTELVLDGNRYIRVLNWDTSFEYTVIVIPNSTNS